MTTPIIVALDFPDAAAARRVVDRLDPGRCAVKVGKELFTAAGPDFVRACVARGFRVFLDLKFHDIPTTCAQACAAATRLGVWMVNVHASGGTPMMAAARKAVDDAARDAGRAPPLLIAVTVLTSLGAEDLASIGVPATPAEHVVRLAKLAQGAGLDGVVCSAKEAVALRAACGPDFRLVTPGIRPAGAAAQDQVRVTTPAEAIAAGADWLVIGRPITGAPDPAQALADIAATLRAH
ncbi:MAG TPA: orotidine-5'-phosphate decarboxylase [Casimicrobiaceae bacterium]|nr:orotidine-5'-phosphate decarboxylase [Casimicrobiaceae bacterium]